MSWTILAWMAVKLVSRRDAWRLVPGLLCGALAACTGTIGSGTSPSSADGGSRAREDGAAPRGDGAIAPGRDAAVHPDAAPPCEPTITTTVADTLPPLRLLRRASLALRGAPPTAAELATLDALGDEATQRAWIDGFVDRTLVDPVFYRTAFELGRDWLNIPPVSRDADEPEYGPQQQRSLQRCPAGTPHAGSWGYVRDMYGSLQVLCSGTDSRGRAVETVSLEPWWAPDTQVTLIGSAANTTNTGTTSREGNPVRITCDGRPEGSCGCGPNAVSCHADFQQYAGWEDYVPWNEEGQRRQLAEEPARWFAHLVWHDRGLDELISSTHSVGTTKVVSAYVMQGAESGDLSQLGDDAWWRPSKYQGAPVDPLHTAGDPMAWREFDVPTASRVFIADRDYRYDPRTTTTPIRGVPASGFLTSIGFLGAYPRERLRAARALEVLACEVLAPPSGQAFNEYRHDPAREGPCQHCHLRIDPAAIHFKRYAKAGAAFEGWGAEFPMPAVGGWRWPARWRTGEYPYHGNPFAHWNRWYTPDTAMTPVTAAQVAADPMVVFIDFLPPDQNLLGQVSDGTVGPLGFAKLILAAGAYDRCVTRRLHQWVMGRDVDPATETGYLDDLTARFVAEGRRARPLVKYLTTTELFRRGL